MSELEDENIPKFKFTEEWIINQLEKRFPADEFAFFGKQRLGTGFGKDSQQEFDAWGIHYLKGKRNFTTCFEIKTSRNDFFNEIKKPQKRRAGLRLSHCFYFVTPKGLVKIEEVPPECGLLEIDEKENIEIIIEAPYRESYPTWQFVASLSKRLDAARRAEAEMEKRIKGVVYEREIATRVALDRHLDKWRTHNIGSRELPDKILDALEDLKIDVEESMKANRKIK